MSWEWEYKSNPPRWTVTIGEWCAVVQRVEGKDYAWRASVERTTEPHDRHDGPTNKDAMVARTWCLTKIAELRAAQS